MNNMFFNVRVYGLLINATNEVLISDEQEYGFRFTKFPGGGLEYGEGLIEGLKREFVEECNTEVEVTSHFYTTDFFVKSAFNDSQIISVYYLVKAVSDLRFTTKIEVFDFEGEGDILQSFRWVKLSELNVDAFTFPTDQYVADLLLKTI
ncbi:MULTISPECIES: NUDIX domain-containing protein [unclassified Mucilaginibacter]|uniref:NUDIX domain-containing protein n=1 Tax=unclassified Mucilaginibacter TaxID=2617802 RepID=UPI002AC8FFDE|nr:MULTISPECIES: NUDIX domain-containing protein [unclassified Mucilaginibacter]MEB0249170.1 NUDIX domain-containing protein [Mucilaginibacter sp. 5B2]MEB0260148.1 NUDIX domain-containing protein [Mucilaginibacter sp. 10I4]MEB0279131.1 NUDIX domain-containing protein [Mucilaginibacter sp. 10B2]MEB0302086.1 NUDIX domain-containing protein [Mucilaginibacter sp. 5C4]WPX22309.1 NUDIX domain-containing protein [Mucilaginibacter sp. 5C4]